MRKILILAAGATAALALLCGPVPEAVAQTSAKEKQCTDGCTKRWGSGGKSYGKCVELCLKGGRYN